jgi:hypothetical protein
MSNTFYAAYMHPTPDPEWEADDGNEYHTGYPAYTTPDRPLFDFRGEVVERTDDMIVVHIHECISDRFVGLRIAMRLQSDEFGNPWYVFDHKHERYDNSQMLVGLAFPASLVNPRNGNVK